MEAYVVLVSFVLVFGLLGVERLVVRRLGRRIPMRIAVLGTRGKSSVVRLIAFGLRASSRRVIYKTTGSRPVFGHATGGEQVIRRRSVPTPLEQRRVLRVAAHEQAEVAVIEAMSIRPESLRAEVGRLLAPQIVVVTTVGKDHIVDIEDPCAAFAAAVPRSALVIAPATAPAELFRSLERRGIAIRKVDSSEDREALTFAGHVEWHDNIGLALAACEAAGVDAATAQRGMESVIADFGALAAWRVSSGAVSWIAVNGFAANDPDATRRVLAQALGRWGHGVSPVVGILNLRRDRGDRTLQWTETLVRTAWPFEHLIVVGHAPWEIRRRLRRTFGSRAGFPPGRTPEAVMEAVSAAAPNGGFLFGLGNIAGVGEHLISDWKNRGETL